MLSFTKVVRLGTQPNLGSVFCEIKFTEDHRLSITGVEGPMRNGNAKGGCGQITIDPANITPAPCLDVEMIKEFKDVWETWHLNDMQAGTPAQTAELKKHKFPGGDHFTWAQGVLRNAGLQPDNGYLYGTKWLKVEIPHSVLKFLRDLPTTDETPAWV